MDIMPILLPSDSGKILFDESKEEIKRSINIFSKFGRQGCGLKQLQLKKDVL